MTYIRIIGLSLIPAFLTYIGKDNTVWELAHTKWHWPSPEEMAPYKFACFIVGLLWLGLVMPVQLANTKKSLDATTKQFDDLVSFGKDSLFQRLHQEIGCKNHPFN